MMLNHVTAAAGANKRRKRVGRGESSGHGKTCTRGNKGAQSRAGGGVRPLTEGGQMPLFRRLPKRGFSNFHFRTEYVAVNLGTLEAEFGAGETVDPAALQAKGLACGRDIQVKILGTGELHKKLTVAAHAFSGKARQAIEAAGGTVQVIERRDPAALAKAKRNSAKRARAAQRADAKPAE